MSKLAYVFPGQGSQAVGMLNDVEQTVRELFEEASSILGYDLWNLISEGPEDQLNQTEFTQPALLTASVALYRLSLAQGLPVPSVVAGHSLGEYSALVAANVLQFADAVALVQKRGQLMQTAVPVGEGGMAVVFGIADNEVIAACETAAQGEIVQAANFNAPGQVVIAGENDALNRAIKACQAAGARRVIGLMVSAPFHSKLMQPAAEEMASLMGEVVFSKPEIEVIQNVDACSCLDPDVIRKKLVSQMYGAVLWTDTIARMKSMGVETIVECGPGKVLSGLVKRIDKSIKGVNINSQATMMSASEALCA